MEVDHAINLKIQEVKDLVVEQTHKFHHKCVEFHTSTRESATLHVNSRQFYYRNI